MKKRIVTVCMAGLMAMSLMGCWSKENVTEPAQEMTREENSETIVEESENNTSQTDKTQAGVAQAINGQTNSNEEEDTTENSEMEESDTTQAETAESETQSVSDSSIDSTEESGTDAAQELQSEESQDRELFTGDALSLSNETIPYGYVDSDRDEKNVPNGVYYYKNLYSKYNADYIQSTEKNTIYLTMDEGYEAGYSPKILDTLKEKNVKAVFFVTKQFVDENPDLVKRMIDEGHIIGNHTCAHPAEGMPSLGYEAEKQDIETLHQMIEDQFGYQMKLFRFPEGAASEQSLALVQSLGYKSVFWSFAHHDWVIEDQPDAQESLQKCLDSLHPGAIYLLHAVSKTNCDIMADFIDGAREKGYEFGVYPTD